MATIVTRKGKRGVRYPVRIHRHGMKQSATFATRDAARTWAQMVEGYAAAHGAGLVPEGVAGHTVAEAIERYRREVLPRKGPGTQQSYDGHLRWWRRRLGSTLLADLRSSEILVHRDRLARHKSPATANRYLASLSAVLSAAMLDWEWIEASPMARVRALPEPGGRVRYLKRRGATEIASGGAGEPRAGPGRGGAAGHCHRRPQRGVAGPALARCGLDPAAARISRDQE